MKTPIRSKLILALFALGTVAVAGVSKATYSNPAAAYPANTDAPINISNDAQTKFGGLSVNTIISRGNARFDQKTTLSGAVLPYSSTTDTVGIGTDVVVSGDIHADGYLNSQTLAGGNLKPLCSDSSGAIIPC